MDFLKRFTSWWKSLWFYVPDEPEITSEFIECYCYNDVVGLGTRENGTKYYLLKGGRKVDV